MVLAAAFAIVMLGVAGLTIPQLFLLVGILNAVVAIYIFTLVPEFLLRFIAWMLVHVMYRLRKDGLEHIPAEGPALLVCNHVSYVDAIVIAGAVRRPIRFVMYHKIFHIPVLRRIFRWMNAIPIAPAKEDPALLERAYDAIDNALANGELVCIFPEGGLTMDGQLQGFRRGVERVVGRQSVPVVPMALSGLWGSLFSRAGGRVFFKRPRRLWARVRLAAGAAIAPAGLCVERLRGEVALLRGERA
jgi:1-acyl-sn-glycerol-3-phosphate acyltransferase